jgi:hypothetical protein
VVTANTVLGPCLPTRGAAFGSADASGRDRCNIGWLSLSNSTTRDPLTQHDVTLKQSDDLLMKAIGSCFTACLKDALARNGSAQSIIQNSPKAEKAHARPFSSSHCTKQHQRAYGAIT